MCGIAGFSIRPDVNDAELFQATWLKELGYEMMSRGRDATGVVQVTASGAVKVAKAATHAVDFFDARRGLGSNARTALLHTRAATQGDPSNHLNNHPITYRSIIGVHNGVIDNDDELFKAGGWKRNGQVDSEAIFAAIDNMATIQQALEAVAGSMAIAWIDATDPETMYLARGSSSPLWIHEFSQGLFFASTEKAIQNLTSHKVKPTAVDEGTILCVKAGEIVDFGTFTPDPGMWRSWTSMSGHSKGSTSHYKFDGERSTTYELGDMVRMIGTAVYGIVVEVAGNMVTVEWEPTEERASSLMLVERNRRPMEVVTDPFALNLDFGGES